MSELRYRTRSRGKSAPIVGSCTTDCYRSNGSFSWTNTVTGDLPPKEFAYIRDELGGKGVSALHNCEHFSFKSVPKSYSNHVGITANGEKYETGPATNMLVFSNKWKEFMSPSSMRISADELDEFNKRACLALMPGIAMSVDIPTALAQLSQVPSLFHSLIAAKATTGILGKCFESKRLAGARKSLLKGLEKFLIEPGAFTHDIVKSIENNRSLGWKTALAGDYLNWQFGWKPTLADAKAVATGIRDVEKALDDLIKGQSEVQLRHYREVTNHGTDVVVENIGSSARFKYTTIAFQRELNATMRYRYKLDHVGDLKSKAMIFKAMLDRYGFNNPTRVIWELIPLSFVVDWIIPVSEYLEQFTQRHINTTIEVEEYCISQTITSKRPLLTTTVFEDDIQGTWECHDFIRSDYFRMCCLPNYDTFGLRHNNRYGAHQFLLSGALLQTFFGKK